MFAFLDGISPWWWIAAGFALSAAEMLVPAFVLIWPGLAALAVGVVLVLLPDLSGNLQVTLFAALGIALAFAGRALFARRGQSPSDRPMLNRRTDRLVGRTGTVLSVTPDGLARVEIDGVPWEARCQGPAPDPGDRVTVRGADGAVLSVARQP